MPRIRTVKPEFFRSPDTARVSFAGRILFEAMWCWADDHGRGETNLYGLLGFAFCDSDGIDVAELQRLCTEIQCGYAVDYYIHRGRHYYAIPSWNLHQKNERRGQTKHPGPEDPESVRDQRFYPDAEMRGNTVQAHGNSGTGTGEQGNRGTGEQNPPTPQPNPTNLPAVPGRRREANLAHLNSTAHSPQAHAIARAYEETTGAVPGKTLGHIAAAIDACLETGIDPHQIAEGLKAWTASPITAPSQIESFVHRAGTKPATGKPTRKAQTYADAAEQLLAEVRTIA